MHPSPVRSDLSGTSVTWHVVSVLCSSENWCDPGLLLGREELEER
jgi:hypothetical protein